MPTSRRAGHTDIAYDAQRMQAAGGAGGGVSTTSATGGTTNIDITGSIQCDGGFGCNGAAAQTAYPSGGPLAPFAAGTVGFDTVAHAQSFYNLIVAIRALLVGNGTMS